MTAEIPRDPETLSDVAAVLEALPMVIDARAHTDLVEWVEIAIEGYGVPPEVQAELARADLSITGVNDQAAAITIANARRIRRR